MILINSSPKDALKIFQPFLPIFVPVGVGCLVAFAERENIRIKFVDEQVEDNVLGVISGYVKDMQKPYIFGFSVLTAAFKRAILFSEQLKKLYPDSVIVFGGIHPTACPDDTLSYEHIDAVIRGEGEKTLVEFYKCVKSKKDFTRLDGLSFRKNGAVVHNKISPDLFNLDDLPSFPYHIFSPKSYDLSAIVSSRGCPYRCIFCSNRVTTGRKYRHYSAKRIIEDIDLVYNRYLAQKEGKRIIQFMDDNLLANRDRIYGLIEEIKKNGFDKKVSFSFQARGDNVDYELLKDMYGAGFRSAFFGIETASERLMKTIKKDETVKQCVEAVKMAKKAGFYVSGTFIYALPGETHNDRMDCLKLSKELKLDMVRYNNATPYPGTELYEIAKNEKRLNVVGLYENFNSVATFIENPFHEIPFSYVPAGNSEKEIRNDLLYSYFATYFDLNKIKGLLINPDKCPGWWNPGKTAVNLIKKTPSLLLLAVYMSVKLCKLLFNLTIINAKSIFYRGKNFKKGNLL